MPALTEESLVAAADGCGGVKNCEMVLALDDLFVALDDCCLFDTAVVAFRFDGVAPEFGEEKLDCGDD